MIVHLPRRRKHFSLPDPIPGIERAEKLNILGTTVSHTLTFHHHVTKCSRSFYALKTIRAHGLNGNALVPLWSHNFSMPALHGGDILKPMKETD